MCDLIQVSLSHLVRRGVRADVIHTFQTVFKPPLRRGGSGVDLSILVIVFKPPVRRGAPFRGSLSRLSGEKFRLCHIGFEPHSPGRLSGGESLRAVYACLCPSLSRLSGGEYNGAHLQLDVESPSRLSGGEYGYLTVVKNTISLSRLSGEKSRLCHIRYESHSPSRLSGGECFLSKEKRKHFNTLRCIFIFCQIVKEHSQVIAFSRIYQKSPGILKKSPDKSSKVNICQTRFNVHL